MHAGKIAEGFDFQLVGRLLMGLTFSLVLAGTAEANDVDSPLAKLELHDGDGIVFYGDSITHQRLYSQYVEDYFYTRFPKMRLRIHNAGVSGSVAWEALERFEPDVAAYKPKYVTVLLGMNDGNHEPFNQTIFATYRRDMTTIFEKIKQIGAIPILMTPTMFDARMRHKWRPNADPDSTELYNAVLAYYGAWLRELAMEQGLGFVDLWGPMNNFALERRKTEPTYTLVPDAVHPNPNGHIIMAVSMIREFGLSRLVSSIRIVPAADNSSKFFVKGGQLSQFVRRDDGVEFHWQADSLPWVFPDRAALDERAVSVSHQVNIETLEIHGLSPGKYALSIDGIDVDTYETIELEHRIDLAGNSKTPQYQQALIVANLNKQRNEGPINALRDEWWNFQDYVDARRDAKEKPDDPKLKKALSDAELKISGMDRRVADADAKAKVIEDKIIESNKPPLRKYVLRRIKANAN